MEEGPSDESFTQGLPYAARTLAKSHIFLAHAKHFSTFLNPASLDLSDSKTTVAAEGGSIYFGQRLRYHASAKFSSMSPCSLVTLCCTTLPLVRRLNAACHRACELATCRALWGQFSHRIYAVRAQASGSRSVVGRGSLPKDARPARLTSMAAGPGTLLPVSQPAKHLCLHNGQTGNANLQIQARLSSAPSPRRFFRERNESRSVS